MSTTKTVEASNSVDMEETHAERNLKLFKTGKYSDVSFIVGDERTVIHAHKLYLRAQSSVFDELFNLEPEKNEFQVHGIKPEYFQLLLKFIYTGTWEMDDLDTAIPLYHAARYYKLAKTSIIERRVMDAELKAAAIVTLMEAFKYGQSEMLEAAVTEICKHAYELVDDPKFLELSSECLQVLIGRDDLAVWGELQLFMALMKWARLECGNVGTALTPKYCRSALEKLIPLIRFPLMDSSDFSLHVYYSDILTTEEVLEVSAYYHVKESQRHLVPGSRLFNCTPRKYANPASSISKVHLVQKNFTASARSRVFIKIAADGEPLGTITFQLHDDVVPLKAEFFCAGFAEKGRNGCAYKGTEIILMADDQLVGAPRPPVIAPDSLRDEKRISENVFGALSVVFNERNTMLWINCSTMKKRFDRINSDVCGFALDAIEVMGIVRKMKDLQAANLTTKFIIVECGQL